MHGINHKGTEQNCGDQAQQPAGIVEGSGHGQTARAKGAFEQINKGLHVPKYKVFSWDDLISLDWFGSYVIGCATSRSMCEL